MGSGKTAVGSALADLLGWPLIDNDHELLAHEGKALLELSEDGPDQLHRRESDQLRRAAVLAAPFVAGVAASVADRPADLAAAAQHRLGGLPAGDGADPRGARRPRR